MPEDTGGEESPSDEELSRVARWYGLYTKLRENR